MEGDKTLNAQLSTFKFERPQGTQILSCSVCSFVRALNTFLSVRQSRHEAYVGSEKRREYQEYNPQNIDDLRIVI